MDSESGTITGYAMVFNSRSKLLFGKFYERIDPKAMNGVLERSDMLMLLDHDRKRGVLGRWEFKPGSLNATVDSIGVRYEFTPPNTALGAEVKEYLVRKDIRGSSFRFTPGVKDHLQRNTDGTYERTILQFDKLEDLSLVFTPAYPETTAVLRSIAEMEGVPQQRMSLDELAAYYADLQDQMNKLKKQ